MKRLRAAVLPLPRPMDVSKHSLSLTCGERHDIEAKHRGVGSIRSEARQNTETSGN